MHHFQITQNKLIWACEKAKKKFSVHSFTRFVFGLLNILRAKTFRLENTCVWFNHFLSLIAPLKRRQPWILSPKNSQSNGINYDISSSNLLISSIEIRISASSCNNDVCRISLLLSIRHLIQFLYNSNIISNQWLENACSFLSVSAFWSALNATQWHVMLTNGWNINIVFIPIILDYCLLKGAAEHA